MKYIIILILVIYLIYRVGGVFFRFLLFGLGVKPKKFSQTYETPGKKAPGSNLNIDHVPEKKGKSKDSFEGGEYVDYEEVD